MYICLSYFSPIFQQQHFPDAVTNIFHHVAKVATELFQWLSTVAKQSDKYMDKMKITNFGYFEVSMAALNEPVLKNFVSNASQQKQVRVRVTTLISAV